MIGMVLVTHGALANALRDAMEHVVGKQKNLATVCIESDAEFESSARRNRRSAWPRSMTAMA